MPDTVWNKCENLSKVSAKIYRILDSLKENSKDWREIYFSSATDLHTIRFPLPYNQGISHMQRLCILKCLRPDKIIRAISQFISEELGEKFN